MHRNVEVLIGRLATDLGLQRRFARRPLEVLREQGLELTEIELEALAALDPRALRAFAAALDSRIRRASFPTESRPADDGIATQTAVPPDQENKP